MSNTINWKKIGKFAVGLLLAEVLVGFIGGGLVVGADLGAATQRLVRETLLSISFSSLLFFLMAVRQDYRPFLHALLSLLLAVALSVGLGAILPPLLMDTPWVLVALEWFTLFAGLIIGTAIGRYVRIRGVRADA